MIPILIIDDDPFILILLNKILREEGYDITTAASGEEGLIQAKTIQPALIICDWVMTGIEGIEVCQTIKQDPQLAAAFFILLTNRSESHDLITGLDAGADDFLSKPIAAGELKARVRAGLRLYQANQALKSAAQTLQQQTEKLESELAEAATYVRSLLPKAITTPISIQHCFLPSQHLGGDCFDYYWLDAEHLVIYLLDVSGHGLGAALPSVFIQNLLRSQSLPDLNFYQPAQVLATLNKLFRMSEQNERYFTIWYGLYNHSTQQLTYASAGHPPALLIAPDNEGQPQAQLLKMRSLPIGVYSDAAYTEATVSISSHSTLYIFSDGIYEVRQKDQTFWNLTEFTTLLVDLTQQNFQQAPTTPRLDLDQLLEKIRSLKATELFEDDCSILQVCFAANDRP
ncbi:SpoIIE family protein phosphatase [Alkalinema sp. FACHB-956]|uniref:SpoIIE family protein phosphatase n=1 Tax=Alkalinema sp. FACHB-956 TaxID=2692768 RepID=UPI0016880E40|nr:SpoIIE family protein phosphatase [Alkalinema sp. FACHB-956]MBD2326566.1 SpoIIE family protein phosphatase [Alkalinema sp. FACHB-956]